MAKKPTDLRDGSTWTHKKLGYAVKIEHSAPAGITAYRRVIALPSGNRRLCSMQTATFRKTFVKAVH